MCPHSLTLSWDYLCLTSFKAEVRSSSRKPPWIFLSQEMNERMKATVTQAGPSYSFTAYWLCGLGHRVTNLRFHFFFCQMRITIASASCHCRTTEALHLKYLEYSRCSIGSHFSDFDINNALLALATTCFILTGR